MVQNPSWEANWSAASQEIPRISRNPKVHYRTHKRPPPVSILGQPNPVPKHTSQRIIPMQILKQSLLSSTISGGFVSPHQTCLGMIAVDSKTDVLAWRILLL